MNRVRTRLAPNRAALLFFAAMLCAAAQSAPQSSPAEQTDVLSMASPDGQIAFRLSISLPREDYALVRPAYEITYRGKPLMDTSYLGLQLRYQQPLLGEKAGLIAHQSGVGGEGRNRYNWLLAEYMQNGSLGRRLNVEARAYNDGVAFRYVIPRTSPDEELLISDEATEFHFAAKADVSAKVGKDGSALPFTAEVPGAGWVEIAEVPVAGYAAMHLEPYHPSVLLSQLPLNGKEADLAVTAVTPLTGPWRVLLVAADRARLGESTLLSGLK